MQRSPMSLLRKYLVAAPIVALVALVATSAVAQDDDPPSQADALLS